LLRDPDGTPSGISREDFAFAVFEELENGNDVRQ
jgi:putative NADH-flavin reductase